MQILLVQFSSILESPFFHEILSKFCWSILNFIEMFCLPQLQYLFTVVIIYFMVLNRNNWFYFVQSPKWNIHISTRDNLYAVCGEKNEMRFHFCRTHEMMSLEAETLTWSNDKLILPATESKADEISIRYFLNYTKKKLQLEIPIYYY